MKFTELTVFIEICNIKAREIKFPIRSPYKTSVQRNAWENTGFHTLKGIKMSRTVKMSLLLTLGLGNSYHVSRKPLQCLISLLVDVIGCSVTFSSNTIRIITFLFPSDLTKGSCPFI